MAYRQIFLKGRYASRYKTIYVDGFAGSGERTDSDPEPTASSRYSHDIFGQPFEKTAKVAPERKRGSARVALELLSPFDQYLFVEKNAARASQLRQTIADEHPNLQARTRVELGDANSVIAGWCASTDWNEHRAVVFLDPYGMTVDWKTIECIAGTKAIDLWILFPLGAAGLNRMLTRGKKPPAAWIDKIDRILGTKVWQERFYKEFFEQGLFEDEISRVVKTATFASMTQFFLNRLASVFEDVSPEAMALTNSTGNPLYVLCFAAGSKAGAPIAVRIANHLLRD